MPAGGLTTWEATLRSKGSAQYNVIDDRRRGTGGVSEESASGRAKRGDPHTGWRVLLSHHRAHESHHCFGLGFVALCARCVGLYPVLLLVVLLEAGLGRLDLGVRWFLAFALVIPAVIDWSRSKLFSAPGNNGIRLATGALAGLGLGIAFSDYLRDSNLSYFWALMGSLTAVVLMVWWASRASERV